MANNQSMVQLATHYHELTQNLVKNENGLLAEEVLDTLITRDSIAHLWHITGPANMAAVRLIAQGDQQLKIIAQPISRMKELKIWRENFNPPAKAWWWRFSPPESRFQRFDWLVTTIAVVFLIISAGLITDIAPRYLSGGPDIQGAFIVTAQTLIALLTTSSILTKTGQETGRRILTSLGIPKEYWQEVGAVVALLILIVLIMFRLSLPQQAIAYNDNGLANYCAGYLTSAQFDYTRALKLNPDYLEAHYNLGVLYEDLQNLKEAQTHYLTAVQGGLLAGYNKLAYLYLLNKNYPAAISLLLTGLDRIRKGKISDKLYHCQLKPDSLEQPVPEEAPLKLLQYELLKNLGWARVEQERYEEAEPYLEEAINLFRDKAPAYCLRAQVRAGLKDTVNAKKDWKTCLSYASSYNADEDVWIGLARQKSQ